MRIMYLTQWFDPEPGVIKGPEFVLALVDAGHDVTVVTALPNYPSGRIYPGYRLRPIMRETIGGIGIIRLPLYPSHDASSLRRSLNFLSFFLAALLYCLFRRQRFDLAYVYHPPITVGLAAAVAGLVRPLPFVLDVQDLWPDTIAATGMTGASRLVGPVGRLCDFVYRRARAIVAQSDGMRRALIARGVSPGKITTIRNWAQSEWLRQGHDTALSPLDGRRTRIVYGGNFGRAQALATVVDAAILLQQRGSNVEILLYGEGVEDAGLRARARTAGVSLLRFMDRVPREAIVPIFLAADALLMHLRDEALFRITIPSKTQFYLGLGRPIIAGVGGEAAALLRESGAAIVAPPDDAAALADAIERFAGLDAVDRRAMGEAGLAYYRRTFGFGEAIDRTLAVLAGTQEAALMTQAIA